MEEILISRSDSLNKKMVIEAISMTEIKIYTQLWEYCRLQGQRTIEIIDEANTWDFRVNLNEFSVRETFRHTVKAIFEDAGNWFLKNSKAFHPSDSPAEDLNWAVERMTRAIANFSDTDLKAEFIFQWGEKTTVAGAIQQNLFHAVGHFSQLRNWTGIYSRRKGEASDKSIL
jgi:hypothetical protein